MCWVPLQKTVEAGVAVYMGQSSVVFALLVNSLDFLS